MRKIAFTCDQLIMCGGLIVPAIYVRELSKRGYDAGIYAKQRNIGTFDFYTKNIFPYENLKNFTDEDVILNVWWRTVEEDEKFKGRKIQFVQGNDITGDIGEDYKQKNIKIRNRNNWEILAVSEYALEWTGRKGTIIPNGIDERFFVNLGLERDIDALIEGNAEKNKNIIYAIEQAKKDGNKKIVWLGRETFPISGVERITNPKQEDIPSIYQRAKHFYKYSLSEGFCLPILEAKASGCIIHTWDMGHNFPENVDVNEYHWDDKVDKLIQYIEN